MATNQLNVHGSGGFAGRFASFCLILMLAGTTLALDPRQLLGQFRLVRWDEEQGLPQNYTANIAQTKDGFIWLAFDHGLIRFDGKNFAIGEELHLNIKPPDKVFGLVPGNAGELWIGSYRALYCRLANGEFERFDSKDGLPNDYLNALFLDREGTLWIGTDNHGLFQLKHGRFSGYPGSLELGQHYIYAMCETGDALWVGTALGAYRIDKKSGGIKKFTKEDGLPGNQIYGITTDRSERVWAGTGNGLARFDNDHRFELTTKDLADHPIQSLMTDSHGMIWASGSSGGLWRITPETGEVSALPLEKNSPLPDIQSVYEDREGNIWLATSAGLERLSDVQFTMYTTREGLPNDQITAVFAGRSGRVWVGTLNGLASLYKERVEISQTASRGVVTSVYEDGSGALWYGLQDTTLHRLADGRDQLIASLNTADQSGPGWATGMCDDPQGDLWVGTTGNGLHFVRNGENQKTYTLADGLRDRSVFALAIDRKEELWIGEGEGVDILQKSGIKTAPGENSQILPNAVLCLYADNDGAVWAGTDNGLYRAKAGRWASVVYRSDTRLLGPEFYCLLEDDNGNIWSSSSRGIFLIPKRELNEFFDRKRSSINCHAFGTADGLRSPQCTAGFPAGCRSLDGRLWFATTAGLAAIDPNHLKSNPLPPPVQIEKVVVDLTHVHAIRPGRSTVELRPGAHSLEIDYAALSFSAPEKVRFRYILEGFDRDWIDAANRREAYYTNLAPGAYRFKVTACNSDGLWLPQESAAVASLIVHPRLYQTIWFYMVCAGAVVAVVWLLWRWRLQQILDERTRLSRELHDTAARGIVALIWQIEGAKSIARRQRYDALFSNLEAASKLARESLRETRRAVRALRSEIFDSDCSLAAALRKALEEVATGVELKAGFKISGSPYSTSRTWEQALLRITQESYTNTLKYAHAKRFEVELCYYPDEIRLQLRDDGIGFDYRPGYRKSYPAESWIASGLGLVGIEERVRQLGGRIEIESTVNCGTTIRVAVPRRRQILMWLRTVTSRNC